MEQPTERLYDLPGVEAVALGGSRAQGTAQADSDWDLGLYYRRGFAPESIRDLGYPGEVFEIGGWGGGIFNGGAWLRVEGRRVDVHYRDLDVVEREVERAQRGEFGIESLMFHLAGIPTYVVVAELAINRVLRGELPVVATCPQLLRQNASQQWRQRAELHLDHADKNSERAVMALGLVARALMEFAHAITMARGQWVTNEKRLLEQAGLTEAEELIRGTEDVRELVRGLRELQGIGPAR